MTYDIAPASHSDEVYWAVYDADGDCLMRGLATNRAAARAAAKAWIKERS